MIPNTVSKSAIIREMDADELEAAYQKYTDLPFASYEECRELEMIERQYQLLTGSPLPLTQ